MAIYVDYPQSREGKYNNYCHLMTNGAIQELHDFAEGLGLRRYFQNKPRFPHYDVSPRKRIIAIRLGAIEITSQELIRKCIKPYSLIQRIYVK